MGTFVVFCWIGGGDDDGVWFRVEKRERGREENFYANCIGEGVRIIGGVRN